MSRAAKSIVILLLLLLFVAVGLLAFATLQKQEADKNRLSLAKEVEEFQKRETSYLLENKNLKEKLQQVEEAKADLEKRLGSFDSDMVGLQEKIETLSKERDSLQQRIQSLAQERDELQAKVQEQPEPQVIYKYVEKDTGKPIDEPVASATSPQAAPVAAAAQPSAEAAMTAMPAAPAGGVIDPNDESYWAGVIKEKSALEIQVDDLNRKLTQSMVDVEELKKANSDLEIELGRLTNEKEAIERDIKYGNDLADNLSLSLARAENDKKFLNGRLDKVNEENGALRDQVKRLSSTKIALEKSIVRLQEDRAGIERKLQETESVIRNRIDEIWRIKDSLENSFHSSQTTNANEVELPPIVVSSSMTAGDEGMAADGMAPGFNGNVVSINDENNFVIVDIGQEDGLRLGDTMNVYRGAEYIAALEVIQVRKDISAADIKNKVAKIAVGDVVR